MLDFQGFALQFELTRNLIRELSAEAGKQMKEPFQEWSKYDRLVEELAQIDPQIANCYKRTN